MLKVEDLTINHNNNNIVKGLNLELNKGEILALLGDSGSGKSSTLRFIAGLDNAYSGDVFLDDKNISINGSHKVQPESRSIGMVFQDYALFPHMSVEQNISFGLKDKSKNEKYIIVSELLELIGLQGIEKKYPHQLSGGEQQRVALARSLATKPKLLLMDEPFSNLDKSHRDRLAIQVRSIIKKFNITSILVTHDQSEANTLADKVGTITNKRLTFN